MGLFSRLSTMIKSNINHLISKAEDPEKMLNQTIIEMKEQYAKAKSQVTQAVADEKRLKQRYEKEMELSKEWEEKAKLALQRGREDLAREAVARRNEHQQLANEYKLQWDKQKQATDGLKNQLQTLNRKIDEADRKKNLLIARKKRAEAQKSIHQTISGLSDTSAFDTFDRMAEKVDQLEAEADASADMAALEAGSNLEDQFAELTTGTGAVESDLLELKKSMGLLEEGKSDTE
ncbi:MAG: PspA/IM30 family protein [Gemmatimonadetes bacterium]|nr:MAG: PspA/IM30 family protein [Gemmatimonadota bacterium]